MHRLLHIFTQVQLIQIFEIYISRKMMKGSSLPKSTSLAELLPFILGSIHPISLSLFSDVPKACFCPWEAHVLFWDYGRMPLLIVLLHLVFLVCWYVTNVLSLEVCVWNRCERVCSVYVSVYWILITPLSENVVTTPTIPPPPAVAFGRNTEQGWEGCPVPTFGLSHSQRNKPSPKHTLNTCSVLLHCLICIWAQVVH